MELLTVLPHGSINAKIMFVLEAPTDREVSINNGTCTAMAHSMAKELWSLAAGAGIVAGMTYSTFAIRQRVPMSKPWISSKRKEIELDWKYLHGQHAHPIVHESLAALEEEIDRIRPNVIVPLGNLAMFMLTGNWGMKAWRGSLQTAVVKGHTYKVIATHHPDKLITQYDLRYYMKFDMKRIMDQAKSPTVVDVDYNFIIRPDFTQAMSCLRWLLNRADAAPPGQLFCLGTDIETRAGHIACIGFAWSEVDAICIPIMDVHHEEGYWSPEEESALVWVIRKLIAHPKVLHQGQNFTYDMQYIDRYWLVQPVNVFDTMIAHHSVYPGTDKDLGTLSSIYTDVHVYWKEEGKEWEKGVGEDMLWGYNAKDCVRTFEIAGNLRAVHAALPPKRKEAADFQQSMIMPVFRTMRKGVRIDKSRREQFAVTVLEEISKRESFLYRVLQQELNIRSPKQMQELFYGSFGLTPIKKRIQGVYRVTTNDDALRTISEREPLLAPICRKIAELRSLGVFLSTFIRAPLDVDGRMRCSYNIAGTETFRFSSSENAFGSGANLQNIPKGGEDDELELPNIRSLFVPDPGMEFFDIDLDSADLRIVTWESNCRWMKDAFAAGLKPYVEVAKEYHRDPTITKNHPSYKFFKSFCHGTNYLGTAKGLAGRLGLLVHEAERIQKWYFQVCPEIAKWQDDFKKKVASRRYVENVFGYRWTIFGRVEGNVFNQAVAWLPQSTVGCLINRGYKKIDEECQGTIDILLQVHDSLAGQFPIAQREAAISAIMSRVEIPLPYDDPLTIPVGIKTSTVSWGDCG